MRKLLKWLWIIQIKRLAHKHSGITDEWARLNPYNPLSYVTLVIAFIVALLMYGFVGIWKEVNNPFKWQ